MAASVSHSLDVPGASLYFERRGSGPMLLSIAGGNGDAVAFEPLARALSEHYQVVSYDRRGFSRSTLHDPLALGDGAQRLEADCEDARRLIEHVGGGYAQVLGSSSGAIVALHLLLRHPERVSRLVAHEPPLIDLLPDAAEHVRLFAAVYARYRELGVEAAMQRFLPAIGLPGRARSPGELPAEQRAPFSRMLENQATGWSTSCGSIRGSRRIWPRSRRSRLGSCWASGETLAALYPTDPISCSPSASASASASSPAVTSAT
jgi:pimeloyl-ACP methyl ester carboxylesterase